MKNKKGFTLVEILAVIILLGVISSIAIVSVTKYKQRALENEKKSIRGSITSSFANYRITNLVNKVKKNNSNTVDPTSLEANKVSLSNLSFDKSVKYNNNICNMESSYIYYVVRGDFGIKGTTQNGESFDSKAEEICLYLVCNNEIVIDDTSDENSICYAENN
jgi:prepilin-type N-terminal cleavage/methylation domain